jgi:phosphoribosylamine--glycine ligase
MPNSEEKNQAKNGSETKKTPNPKKFLFVSDESLSGDLAWQIRNEGHQVKAFIEKETDKEVFDGFIEKTDDWKSQIDWADVIVFDDIGFGNEAESLRKKGKLVIGGSKYTDKLEEDREYAQNEMQKFGMIILPHWDFEDFEAAIEFIKSNPGRYVFKPSGNTPSDSKGILFLGQDEDGMDLIEVLEQNKKTWGKKIKKFQLQKMAEGVEVAVGAFFNGEDFIYPINVNFEHKKLFPGDLGPYTGEMGTLVYWSPPNKIFETTLMKMKDELAKSGYAGYVDINCIANARGIYPLEFTMRFGYPTINIQMEGITEELGEFLYKLAKKEKFELKVKKGFQIGVCVVVPPFPYDDKKETAIYHDLSILFRKLNYDGVHLGDVKRDASGVWSVAGDSGYILIITGAGTTVEEARKQAYSRLNNIILQNMYYRVDIGLKWLRDSDRLQTWGYLY